MKKHKIIVPIVFFFLLICVTPVYASSGKIHSLSLSTLSVTRNSQETFHWLMCNNKLNGYSNFEKDQHAYYSESITSAQFETLLNNAFGDSRDNDLNFFYFTGHTIFESIDPISGPLGINLNVSTADFYSFNTLAQKLNSYKGRMIVILDTCGSEAFITDGINILSNSSRISAICSCGYLEESEFGYGYLNPYLFFNGYRYNTFTYAIGKGLGFFNQNKNLLADSNNDGNISIQELFQYTRNNTNSIKEMNVRMFSQNASAIIFSYGTKGISIKLNKSKLTICKGKTITLKATVTGTSTKAKWTSSNSSIATVNSNGKITAKKSGTCKITATVNGKSAACTVTVKSPAFANNAYKKIIQKYELKYGKAKLITSGYMHYWKGVCFAKLLDFNNDGTKELILAYQNGFGKTDKIKYHVELWTFDGKNIKKICSSVSWTGNNCEYFGGFSIIKFKGYYLLFLSDGAVGNDVYYGKKSNGTLGAVHSFHWKGDAMEGQWYYNGKAISVNDYINYYNQFHPNSNWYSFASEKADKTIRSELAKTRKALKL